MSSAPNPMQLLDKIFTALKNPKMAVAFARWNASRLVGHAPRIRFRTIDGQISHTSIGGWISFSEYWTFSDLVPKNEEKLCLNSLARSGKESIAFDIGANLGVFTCRIASLGYSVHSFEPIPETFERLQRNIEFNGLTSLVHLNRSAIGAASGTVSFEKPENSPAQNRISVTGGEGTTDVPVIRLDDYAEDENITSIDFLKIDVEGMETRVLLGARRLLIEKRVATILLEVCPWNLINAGTTPNELYYLINESGYEPHRLLCDGEIGEIVTEDEFPKIVFENLVIIPKP